MIVSICLLSCALTAGQPTDRTEWQLTPQLAPGLELVYRGTFLDESLIPNVQHQRSYFLESSVLVLGIKANEYSAAIVTSLTLQEGGRLTSPKDSNPTSAKLELVNIDLQGRIRRLDKKLFEVPLAGPPTLEAGFLVPAPLVKVGRHFLWQVSEENRPVQRWQVVGPERCGGETCVKVTSIQQSEDWDRPRADQTAWRRSDALWLNPQLNVAQKVERVIERREPARQVATHRYTVRYELESRLRYPQNMYEERKQEILLVKKLHDDTQPLVLKPAQHRLEIDGLIQRVNVQLARPGTLHYRKMFVHIKNQLDTARQGDIAPPRAVEEPGSRPTLALAVGQRAPDFSVSSLTAEGTDSLKAHHGKPVVVVFYNPTTAIGREIVGYAKELNEKHGDSVAIMAMAVAEDADLVRKQHQEYRLKFPILDGNGMRFTFGALQTPRIVLLDSDGLVRLAQTGWGYHTPEEIRAELQRCLAPRPK